MERVHFGHQTTELLKQSTDVTWREVLAKFTGFCNDAWLKTVHVIFHLTEIDLHMYMCINIYFFKVGVEMVINKKGLTLQIN